MFCVCSIRCLIIFGIVDCLVFIVVVGYIDVGFPAVQFYDQTGLSVLIYDR